jgi:hypothetical protein
MSNVNRYPLLKHAAILVLLTTTTALSGCATLDAGVNHSVTVHSQDEAGTVLVSPTMIAPWADISAALKPSFTLTGDTAVAQVLPTTAGVQEEVLDAFGASLGLGLPQSSTSSSRGVNAASSNTASTNNGVTTTTTSASNGTTSSSTTTTGAGVVPTTPTGIPLSASLPSAAAPGALGLDPGLKYSAAMDLFEEVQLLNQELNFTVQRHCWVPYVIKLKLGLMNYRPHLAYSAHTRISFFASPLGRAGPDQQMPPIQGDATTADACPASGHVPVVVPLLSADDLSVALRSQAAETARQLGLALNFMVHGVGGSASANKVKEAMRAISEDDLTSTLTISRETDNTLYALIEPNNIATGDPSLVGRTYDVAILLLIPRELFGEMNDIHPAKISLVTYSEFRNAFDGGVLPDSTLMKIASEGDQVMPRFLDDNSRQYWTSLEPEGKYRVLASFAQLVNAGNYPQFSRAVCAGVAVDGTTWHVQSPASSCNPLPDYAALWSALSSIEDVTPFKSALIEAPLPAPVKVTGQHVVVADDGTHPIQVSLYNVDAQSTSQLGAHLLVTPMVDPPTDGAAASKSSKRAKGAAAPGKTAQVKGPPMTLPAQSLSLSGHVLTLTFPNLSKLGVKKLFTDTADNQIFIELVGCDPVRQLCPAAHVDTLTPVLVSIPPPGPSIALASEGGVIVIKDGGGSLPLVVKNLPVGETGGLTVAGASLTGVTDSTGAAVSLKSLGQKKAALYQLAGNSTYTLAFSNLTPGVSVTVSVQGLKSTGDGDGTDPATATYTAIGGASAPASSSH